MTEKSSIGLSDSAYVFKAFGNIVPLQPNPSIQGTVARSYLAYADNYFKLALDYTRNLEELLKEQDEIYKKYNSLREATEHDEFNEAHSRVAFEIYKLPSIFTNACLSIELTLKALIAHDEGIEDIDMANKRLKKEYSRSLTRLAQKLKNRLGITEKELSLITKLNIMYSGAKRFQYPHAFRKDLVVDIPEIQQVVYLASRLLKSVATATQLTTRERTHG